MLGAVPGRVRGYGYNLPVRHQRLIDAPIKAVCGELTGVWDFNAGPAAAEGLNASYNPTRCAGRHMKVTHTIKAAMFLLMLDQYSKLYRFAGQREVVLRQIYKELKGTLQ
jgi:hypothetical protein